MGKRSTAKRTKADPRRRSVRTIAVVLAAGLLVATAAFAVNALKGGSVALSQVGTQDFHALLFLPEDRLWFGHHQGILESRDLGETWTAIEGMTGDAMALAYHPSGAVYAAGHNVFQIARDGGNTWEDVATDLPGLDIHGFMLLPADPDTAYAFVVGHGLYLSADAGQSWDVASRSIAPDVMSLAASHHDAGTLYAGTMQSGLLISTDRGRTWEQLESSPSAMIAALATNRDGNVYVGTQRGVYRSDDAGRTWTHVADITDVRVIGIHSEKPNVIVVVNGSGNVYRSTDGGATWR